MFLTGQSSCTAWLVYEWYPYHVHALIVAGMPFWVRKMFLLAVTKRATDCACTLFLPLAPFCLCHSSFDPPQSTPSCSTGTWYCRPCCVLASVLCTRTTNSRRASIADRRWNDADEKVRRQIRRLVVDAGQRTHAASEPRSLPRSRARKVEAKEAADRPYSWILARRPLFVQVPGTRY